MGQNEVFDVIIVGAGPCGLAMAARLRENTPASTFTDEEHRRMSYRKKKKHHQARDGNGSRDASSYNITVLDSTDGQWLGRWKHLFRTFDISHLRSPLQWHCDPLDDGSLLAHAYRNERESELVEILHCVGTEGGGYSRKKQGGSRPCGARKETGIAINIRDKHDYFTASHALFCDQCDDVAERYKLGSELIHKETLLDLDYAVVPGVSRDKEKLFMVETESRRRYARAVVLAVGPGNGPKIPSIASAPTARQGLLPQACHSMQIKDFPDPVIKNRLTHRKSTNVMVIGGGLTSAQLSDLAVRKGVTKVWHLMRGPCQVKSFDVTLQWMGRYKNAEQAKFFAAESDEERLKIMREARGGGSITPLFHKKLKKHIQSGAMELLTDTRIADAHFEGTDGYGHWKVETEPPTKNLPPIDYIYFATGIQSDFTSLPYLQKILEKHPIDGIGGFPCINNNLMWSDDVPLFVVGRLASLRLGPAAPNLGGARVSADWVASALERILDEPSSPNEEIEEEDGEGLRGYMSGNGNMYSVLCES